MNFQALGLIIQAIIAAIGCVFAVWGVKSANEINRLRIETLQSSIEDHERRTKDLEKDQQVMRTVLHSICNRIQEKDPGWKPYEQFVK